MEQFKGGTLHYYLVVDTSGSMQDQMPEVLQELRAHWAELTRLASEGKEMRVSVLKFDSSLHWMLERAVPDGSDVFAERRFVPDGGTALFDAVGQALERAAFDWIFSAVPTADGKDFEDHPDTEVVVMVFSDGGENRSRKYGAEELGFLLESYQNKKGWTVGFTGCDWAGIQGVRSGKMREDRMVQFGANEKGKAVRFMTSFVEENIKKGGKFHEQNFRKNA